MEISSTSSEDAECVSTSGTRNVKKHRKQKYRQEWESIMDFKGWLGRDRNSEYNAKCTICSQVMMGELTTIRRHSKTQKHKELQKNISSKQKDMMSRFTQAKGKLKIKSYKWCLTCFI